MLQASDAITQELARRTPPNQPSPRTKAHATPSQEMQDARMFFQLFTGQFAPNEQQTQKLLARMPREKLHYLLDMINTGGTPPHVPRSQIPGIRNAIKRQLDIQSAT